MAKGTGTGRKADTASDAASPAGSGTPPVLNGTPRLRFGRYTWTDADLDVTWRVNAVEALAGATVDPQDSSLALVAWLAVLLSEATGTDVGSTLGVLQQMKYSDLRGALVRS